MAGQGTFRRVVASAAVVALLSIGSVPAASLDSSAAPSLAARHDHNGDAHHHRFGNRTRHVAGMTRPPALRQTRVTAPAVEAPVLDPAIGSVFDLSGLAPAEMGWAQDTLANQCTYDWSRLASNMGDRRVRVELGTPSARGMYYPPEFRMEIHRYFYEEEREVASRTLAWEAAHVIDVMSFTDEQRSQIHALYHGGGSDSHGYFSGPYDDQVGEAFMEGFVAAFCPSLAAESSFNHVTTPEVAEGIRQILQ